MLAQMGEDVETYTAIQELDIISLIMIGLHNENEAVIWIEQDGKRYTQKEICEAVKEIIDLRLKRNF